MKGMQSRHKNKTALAVFMAAFVLLFVMQAFAADAALNKTKASVKVGKKITLTLSGAKVKKWTTSNKAVAVVKDGVVTGKKAGTVTIKAVTATKKYACKVTVRNPARLSKTKVSLEEGRSVTLKVKNVTGKVTWKSKNTAVAKVSSKGKVTAKKAGTAKITATVYGKTLTCNVTVTAGALMPVSNIAAWSSESSGAAKAGNEFLVPYNNKEVPGRVQINPKHIWYEDGNLYAECFVINGLPKSVTRIELVYVRFLKNNVRFAEAGFGVLDDFGSIPPHGTIMRTFCFPKGYVKYNIDLKDIATITWQWNNKLKYE